MIELQHLSKRYDNTMAVSDLTALIHPGLVTGFLGPNGAGKSTTMRMIVGLDHPTTGAALVEGRPYVELPAPMRSVGAMLDGRALHPARSGRHHLQSLAATHRIPSRRVDEVLGLVGLDDVADRRASSYSVGMAQRLGIAAAMLGDPSVLVLDEPANGLDPAGIVWMRGFLRSLAAEGRTVFVSSHLVAEVANVADRVLIIGRGRVLADQTLEELTASTLPTLKVRSPERGPLRELVLARSADATTDGPDGLAVRGMSADALAALALKHTIEIHELTTLHPSLEDVYLALTADAVDYRGAAVSLSAVSRQPSVTVDERTEWSAP